jgi:NADPH:quinone reductase
MRAIVLDSFGEPAKVLTFRDIPIPQPGPGQIRVRMLAAPVNPSDLMVIRGAYGRLPRLPASPGLEGTGVVDAAGPGLFGYGLYLKNKRVCVIGGDTGTWAEYAIVSARQAIPISGQLTIEQGAMFFVNPATAFAMTRRVLKIPKNSGEFLMQTAAGSALGKMIIRLAQHDGYRTINIVRRAELVPELKALGADHVTCEGPGLAERILEATQGVKPRFALDAVGGAAGSALVHCLGTGGRLLVYGTLSGEPLTVPPRDLMIAGASVEGFWLGTFMARQKLVGKLKLIGELTRLIRSGILGAEVGRSFPLEQAAEAVAHSEAKGRGGKVLLRIAEG